MDYTLNTEKKHQEKEIDVELLKKKRQSLLKKNVFKKSYTLILLLFFILISSYIFLYSPFFRIKDVEVNSLEYIDQVEIQNDFEYLKEQNFFLTELSPLRENVIQKHPFIKRIHTEKVFSDTVIINIVEKTPFVIVNSLEKCFLVDNEGAVLEDDSSGCINLKTKYSVKEISGLDIDGMYFKYGEQSQFYNAWRVYEVMNVLNYYNYSIKAMTLESQILRIFLHDDSEIVFSLIDDIDTQLKRLIILTKQLEIEGMSFNSIDVRYNRPVLIEKM